MGGNDTYIFNAGDGNDIITDTSGTDKIIFGGGISRNNLSFVRLESDLVISVDNSADNITVKDWFTSATGANNNKIERLELSNGQFLTSSDINTIVQQINTYAAGYGALAGLGAVNNNQDIMTIVFST